MGNIYFDKYDKKGDYHWQQYDNRPKSSYTKHAKFCKKWIQRKGRILDVGSGDGLITSFIGAEGVDDNKTAVELAVKRGVNVKLGSAYHLLYERQTFDAVFMGDVIEHLEFPEKALHEVFRILKKGGVFYLVTPPFNSEKGIGEYHYREYSPEELTDFVCSIGFNQIEEPFIQFTRMYSKFQKP